MISFLIPSTAVLTASEVSSLIFWSNPASSRSWFQMTWKQDPARQPLAEAITNNADDSNNYYSYKIHGRSNNGQKTFALDLKKCIELIKMKFVES